jgi:hypothetical protein
MAAASHSSPPLPSASPRMASVLPPPSPRPRSRFSTAAASGSGLRPTTTTAPHLQPLPPSPPTAWAASFEQEEPVLDLDEETELLIPEADLVDLRDDEGAAGADETVRPASPVRPPRVRASSGHGARQRQPLPTKMADGGNERLPPQTVLARVLRELEDDYAHYKACVHRPLSSASGRPRNDLTSALSPTLLQDLYRARRSVQGDRCGVQRRQAQRPGRALTRGHRHARAEGPSSILLPCLADRKPISC